MKSRYGQFSFRVIGGVVVVFLLVADYLGLTTQFANLINGVTLVPKSGVKSLINLVESPYHFVKRSVNSARKIQNLEYRYSEVLAQLGEVEGLRQENEELRFLIENTDRKARESLVSFPVVSNFGPSIGVGREDRVRSGDLIFISQTVVGRLTKVEQNSSQVSLVFEKNFEPLVVVSESEVKGILKGDGKQVILTEVSFDDDLEVGERLVTLGQSGVDKDLFVGVVGSELSRPSDPMRTFQVIQEVDFYESRVVEVLK